MASENRVALYQTIFEQQIQSYLEIVHQTSTLLLHNTSNIVLIDQIRPVSEQIQQAVAFCRQEKGKHRSLNYLEISFRVCCSDDQSSSCRTLVEQNSEFWLLNRY